jgi:hypothetical protein
MAEIKERKELTEPGDDGWKIVYKIQRDDGEFVTAEVTCTRTAEQIAQAQGNSRALESMGNYGGIEVLEYAERVQSPSRRGLTLITAFYDSVDGGNLSLNVSYERSL